MGVTPPGSGVVLRRSDIVLRAESWLRPPVPHHPQRFHHNEHGIYRTDAAGYVSMAWAVLGIPPRRHGGLDIAGLVDVSDLLAAEHLRAGDALVWTEPPEHIVLFHEWTDDDHVAFRGFEQVVSAGTVHRVIAFPHPTGSCAPRRYRLLAD